MELLQVMTWGKEAKTLKGQGPLVAVEGKANSLGHPIGASGARVLTTLIHAMRKRNARRGLVSLCLGGGNAVAMSVSTP